MTFFKCKVLSKKLQEPFNGKFITGILLCSAVVLEFTMGILLCLGVGVLFFLLLVQHVSFSLFVETWKIVLVLLKFRGMLYYILASLPPSSLWMKVMWHLNSQLPRLFFSLFVETWKSVQVLLYLFGWLHIPTIFLIMLL